jgi:hypothetical protein
MYCNNRDYPLGQMVLIYNGIIQMIVMEAIEGYSFVLNITSLIQYNIIVKTQLYGL